MGNDLNHEFDSELVIGLVGAVGTELGVVSNLIRERLELSGYNVREIRISNSVIPLMTKVQPTPSGHFQRISELMNAGNHARQQTNDNSVLALGVAAAIYADRRKDDASNSEPLPKTAYIVRSLKRPEEVEKLRLMYPSGFVLVGVHADESRRRLQLVENLGIPPDQAKELMDRDGDESTVSNGQRVNRTFHLADFFVRLTGSSDRLRCDIQRLVELWFGHPYHTPLFDEYAMYMAFAAALRSADLSRQVGAVVTKDRQVLSTGANECPKANGGLYWPLRDAKTGGVDDYPRGRDYRREEDSNDVEQARIVDEIVQQGKEHGLNEASLRELLAHSSIKDLTEYGRVVHAEMEAILACARNGLSTVGSTIYCTTFPCHNCAKHIVAAGIKRVVYIEPYPKSKALAFHDDSICLSSETLAPDDQRVVFEPFEGVGPRRYFDLFSFRLGSSYDLVRKDHADGKTVAWRIENARLRIQMKACSYLDLEMQACEQFRAHLDKIKEASNE